MEGLWEGLRGLVDKSLTEVRLHHLKETASLFNDTRLGDKLGDVRGVV